MTAGGGITNFSTLEVDGPVTATAFLGPGGIPIVPTTDFNVTATGTNQATAYALASTITYFSSVPSGTGCRLVAAPAVGAWAEVINGDSTNSILVYPASGGSINSEATNGSVAIPAGGSATFWAVSSTRWIVR